MAVVGRYLVATLPIFEWILHVCHYWNSFQVCSMKNEEMGGGETLSYKSIEVVDLVGYSLVLSALRSNKAEFPIICRIMQILEFE